MADVLDKVKKALGITGSYQDDTLNVYIDEVKQYMIDAGVPESVLSSDASAGVISRGVTDLWNYGSAGGKLSDYFCQRVSQLSYQSDTPEPEPTPTKLTKVCTITDKVKNYGDDGTNGIYQKGDEYYLQFLSWSSATRDSKAGWNITLAQIDDSNYYPPVDLFYNCIYNDSYIGTLKIWTTGLITVLPTIDVSTGDEVMVQYTGEYGGVTDV